MPFETRHPILFDRKHPLIREFLIEQHRKQNHQGIEHLRAVITQRFWITRLRATLHSVKAECKVCNRYSPKILQPEMAELPAERLAAQQFPSSFTGVDYFGPVTVTVNRRSSKRWSFMFTCLTTRAVHMEIVSSISTDSCLMAISRFIARRGQPKTIWSDNGTNFVGADHELQRLVSEWNQQKLHDDLAARGITWKFNPPAAPHHGGAWERHNAQWQLPFALPIVHHSRATSTPITLSSPLALCPFLFVHFPLDFRSAFRQEIYFNNYQILLRNRSTR